MTSARRLGQTNAMSFLRTRNRIVVMTLFRRKLMGGGGTVMPANKPKRFEAHHPQVSEANATDSLEVWHFSKQCQRKLTKTHIDRSVERTVGAKRVVT
ncbi:hypothetical protein RB195_023919 [Necator americanus]|uniref:Uncharacterized protein n=1 Tax=Necator americanus TaxID=51031 RepID=A0ABR1EL49_NECAM